MLLAVDVLQGVELLVIGLLAGLLGGLLGIGGGIVMIPAMRFLLGTEYGEDSFHLYKLAAISATLILSAPSATRHWRAGAVVKPALKAIIPAALIGVVAGVAVSALFTGAQTTVLKQIFGAFLVLVVVVNLLQDWLIQRRGVALRRHCPTPNRWGVWASLIGLPAGITAGLLGVGGGAWAVPAQRLGLGIELRHAIANSAASIPAIAAVTIVVQSVMIETQTPLHWWQGLVLTARGGRTRFRGRRCGWCSC
jgi:hypothetical protein